ncbi:MAG: hypothetical protein A4E66_01848 [Syntrophus sp. PtaB.Bin001]|nr:MAG: hypothetical protein A4E66_01848 [Syntrophus sp. PtaB.Bin001]
MLQKLLRYRSCPGIIHRAPAFHVFPQEIDQRQVVAFLLCHEGELFLSGAGPFRLVPVTCRASPRHARGRAGLRVVDPVGGWFIEGAAQYGFIDGLDGDVGLLRRFHRALLRSGDGLP